MSDLHSLWLFFLLLIQLENVIHVMCEFENKTEQNVFALSLTFFFLLIQLENVIHIMCEFEGKTKQDVLTHPIKLQERM